MINGKSKEHADILEKVKTVATSENGAENVQEFKKIIKNKKSILIWSTYHQRQIFQKFKEK